MSQQGLEALLRPKSIAVIGASMKPHRAGYLMMRKLVGGRIQWPRPSRDARLESRFRRHGLAGYRQSSFHPRPGYFMH